MLNFNSMIEEAMDEAMANYVTSTEYQTANRNVNNEIAKFRNSLTSSKQAEDFNHIINLISNQNADLAVAAFTAGVETGAAIKEQLITN